MRIKIKSIYKPSNSAGFTFIELVIVIMILGILSSIAIFNNENNVGSFKNNMAVNQIIDDINFAQTVAIAMNDTVTISINVSDNTYTIYKGFNEQEGERSVMADFPNGDNGVVDFLDLSLGDVNIQSANFNGRTELQFLPLGEPSSGGHIIVNETTISVEPRTGKCTYN
tara:strand:- start:1382 stop:1888 length:507 start_codon:yes stop_codon:yes gene_type:complete